MRAAGATWPAVLGAGVLLAVASIERLVWPQLIGCALLGMVALSLLAVLRKPHFVVGIEMPERLVVAEPFDIVVRLVNNDRRSRRAVVVRHRLRGGRRLVPESVAFVERVRARAEVIVRLTAVPVARGAAKGSDVEIVLTGPFGFFTRSISHQVGRPALALPARAAGLDLPPDAGLRPGSFVGTAGADADMRGVRAWRAGDQLRDVHWRSTARSSHPAVLEREAPAADRAGCVVGVVMAAATRRGRLQNDPQFEQAISITATTMASALRRGTRTCLIAQPSLNTSPTAAGSVIHASDERSVLDYLAKITAAGSPSAESLRHAIQHAGRGGTLLLVANNATPASWKAELLSAAAKAGVNALDVRRLVTHMNEIDEPR